MLDLSLWRERLDGDNFGVLSSVKCSTVRLSVLLYVIEIFFIVVVKLLAIHIVILMFIPVILSFPLVMCPDMP